MPTYPLPRRAAAFLAGALLSTSLTAVAFAAPARAGEPAAKPPAPAPADERPPAAGLLTVVGLNTAHPAVGVPASATVTLQAIEPVSGLALRLRSATSGLRATGALDATDLATGRRLTVPLAVVPTTTGTLLATYDVTGTVRGVAISRTIELVARVAADPAKSSLEQTLSPLLPGSDMTAAAASSPAPTYGANRTQPIIFLNGLDPIGDESGKNVNGEWADHMAALQSWGWTGIMGGASFYECDTNYSWNLDDYGSHSRHNANRTEADNHKRDSFCGAFGPVTGGSHDIDTAIEHIGYHFARMIWQVFGSQCVNVVTHSMGGLVVRYALARVQQGIADFPTEICVDDVVTLGAPHNGSTQAYGCYFGYECTEQVPGSAFLSWLGTYARDPQGKGGTDWTAMGSTGDNTVDATSATTGNFDPEHAVVYDESIAHSSIQGSQHWKNTTSGSPTANIHWTDRALGFQATSQDAPWPGRYMDMSLAYNQWGCGVGNTSSAWPLKHLVQTVGEPYTTSTDCYYYVDVPSGQSSLTVDMASLNNRDLDLLVRYGSPTASATCYAASTGPSETCTINNPAAGRWYVQVANFAHSRDPFTVMASYSAVAAHLTTTSLTSYPSSVSPYESFYVCWNVLGSGTITHTDLHYGSTTGTGTLSPVPAITGTAPQNGNCATVVAPGGGTVYVQSHATGPNDQIYSTLVGIPIVQNDCYTSADAPNTHASAAAMIPPRTDCPAMLVSGYDSDDWYRFSVSAGQTINASIAPNANANFDLCIVDPNNTSSSCSTNGMGVSDSVTVQAGTSGYWRVHVYIGSGTGTYTMSISLGAAAQNDCGTGGDAGGSFSGATSLSVPRTGCSGTLGSGSDSEDWFQFYASFGQYISVEVTPNSSANFDICVLTPDNGATSTVCNNAGTGSPDGINMNAQLSGYFRVRLYQTSGSGSYTFSAAVVTAQNDCGTGWDGGNTFTQAIYLTVPKSNCSAQLVTSQETEDWYQFYASAGQSITVGMTPNASADFDICVATPDNGATTTACNHNGTGQWDGFNINAQISGYFRVRVYAVSGTGSYTLSASVT